MLPCHGWSRGTVTGHGPSADMGSEAPPASSSLLLVSFCTGTRGNPHAAQRIEQTDDNHFPLEPAHVAAKARRPELRNPELAISVIHIALRCRSSPRAPFKRRVGGERVVRRGARGGGHRRHRHRLNGGADVGLPSHKLPALGAECAKAPRARPCGKRRARQRSPSASEGDESAARVARVGPDVGGVLASAGARDPDDRLHAIDPCDIFFTPCSTPARSTPSAAAMATPRSTEDGAPRLQARHGRAGNPSRASEVALSPAPQHSGCADKATFGHAVGVSHRALY